MGKRRKEANISNIALDTQTDSVSGPTVLATEKLRTEGWANWSANERDAERLAFNGTKQQDWKTSFIDYGCKQLSHRRSLYF